MPGANRAPGIEGLGGGGFSTLGRNHLSGVGRGLWSPGSRRRGEGASSTLDNCYKINSIIR